MKARLALEWSSPRISVAIDAGEQVFSLEKDLPRFRMPEALLLVEEVLEMSQVGIQDLNEVLIGRGPGNYTGVRQALAFAMGIAAPEHLQLRCASSGVVLASAISTHSPFWILGDARRDRWWGASFPVKGSPEWALYPPEAWKQWVGDAPVFSSDPTRLQGIEVQESYPHAQNLFVLPEESLQDPLEPLYLHQAV